MQSDRRSAHSIVSPKKSVYHGSPNHYAGPAIPFAPDTIPVVGSKTYIIRRSGMTSMDSIPGMGDGSINTRFHFVQGTDPETIYAQCNKFKSFKKMPILTNLRVFYLSENQIKTFKDFPQFPNLTSLFLEDNNIISFRGACDIPTLTTLNLEGNPIAYYTPPQAPEISDRAYRLMAFIAFNSQILTMIDGKSFTAFERDDAERIGPLVREYLRKGYLLRHIHNEPRNTKERTLGRYELVAEDLEVEDSETDDEESETKRSPSKHQQDTFKSGNKKGSSLDILQFSDDQPSTSRFSGWGDDTDRDMQYGTLNRKQTKTTIKHDDGQHEHKKNTDLTGISGYVDLRWVRDSDSEKKARNSLTRTPYHSRGPFDLPSPFSILDPNQAPIYRGPGSKYEDPSHQKVEDGDKKPREMSDLLRRILEKKPVQKKKGKKGKKGKKSRKGKKKKKRISDSDTDDPNETLSQKMRRKAARRARMERELTTIDEAELEQDMCDADRLFVKKMIETMEETKNLYDEENIHLLDSFAHTRASSCTFNLLSSAVSQDSSVGLLHPLSSLQILYHTLCKVSHIDPTIHETSYEFESLTHTASAVAFDKPSPDPRTSTLEALDMHTPPSANRAGLLGEDEDEMTEASPLKTLSPTPLVSRDDLKEPLHLNLGTIKDDPTDELDAMPEGAISPEATPTKHFVTQLKLAQQPDPDDGESDMEYEQSNRLMTQTGMSRLHSALGPITLVSLRDKAHYPRKAAINQNSDGSLYFCSGTEDQMWKESVIECDPNGIKVTSQSTGLSFFEASWAVVKSVVMEKEMKTSEWKQKTEMHKEDHEESPKKKTRGLHVEEEAGFETARLFQSMFLPSSIAATFTEREMEEKKETALKKPFKHSGSRTTAQQQNDEEEKRKQKEKWREEDAKRRQREEKVSLICMELVTGTTLRMECLNGASLLQSIKGWMSRRRKLRHRLIESFLNLVEENVVEKGVEVDLQTEYLYEQDLAEEETEEDPNADSDDSDDEESDEDVEQTRREHVKVSSTEEDAKREEEKMRYLAMEEDRERQEARKTENNIPQDEEDELKDEELDEDTKELQFNRVWKKEGDSFDVQENSEGLEDGVANV
ncbi:hypothetical protein BLNAU_4407 [Blattamonas nauphoetae]|uniref:Uncharacterized protein n=1 Tax=Blattamonas nauphoetae TaxID=2049346 RepID=A0ABQ9Y9Y4_9EUKA|nr:hypothetical protein BLNAU_4407 [Blattamonas nauphoetae]